VAARLALTLLAFSGDFGETGRRHRGKTGGNRMRSLALLLLLVSGVSLAATQESAPPKPTTPKPKPSVTKTKTSVEGVSAKRATGRDTTFVGQLREEAMALRPLTKSLAVLAFLDSTRALPHPGTRMLYMDSSRTRLYSESQARALGEHAKASLISRPLDDRFYYTTRYGTPLAYARPLDLVAQQGVKSFAGWHVLDFGYGGIGHLRLLASLGANVVGVDVDPLLPVLYGEPGDQGGVPARGGMITLVDGHFPGDSTVAARIGDGYDLFLSKNTLKHGYIHPTRPADKRQLVDLGVDDSTFVASVRRILKPGGYAMIYNLSPALSRPDQPFRPWTDGHDPFPRSLWENNGFEIIAYDQVDDDAARAMGKALKWDEGEGGMNLAADLFGRYTLVKKKGK
jgi:hypothetical protein